VLVVEDGGRLADPGLPQDERAALFDGLFALASPSSRSMRASPDYRLAMLRVLGDRALRTAQHRLADGTTS
jgi:hypothetical protein